MSSKSPIEREKAFTIIKSLQGIIKNETLFGLAMQPRKNSDDDAISDENIYLKWLKALKEKSDDSKSKMEIYQGMVNFTNKLAEFLTNPSLISDYRIAMSKLIKASLEKGIFTIGNVESMYEFFEKNPEILDHFHKNQDLLSQANRSLKGYVKAKRIKILPKKEFPIEGEQQQEKQKSAAEHLKNARITLISKLEKEHDELLHRFVKMNPTDPQFVQCYNKIISFHNEIQRLQGLQEQIAGTSIKETPSISAGVLPAFNFISKQPLSEPSSPPKDTPESPKPF